MLNVIKHESKRFYRIYAMIIAVYIANYLLFFNAHSEVMYRIESWLIILLTTGVSFYPTISFMSDELNEHKYLYQKSSIPVERIILGKALVVLLYAAVTLIIATILFNIKVYLFKQGNPIDFIRMNLDYVELILIDKQWKEQFYVINLLLNILYSTLLLFTATAVYILNREKRGKLKSLGFTVICLIATNWFISLIDKFMLRTFSGLNFNYLTKRVQAMPLNHSEINFLSIPSVLLYISFMVLFVCFIRYRKVRDVL